MKLKVDTYTHIWVDNVNLRLIDEHVQERKDQALFIAFSLFKEFVNT